MTISRRQEAINRAALEMLDLMTGNSCPQDVMRELTRRLYDQSNPEPRMPKSSSMADDPESQKEWEEYYDKHDHWETERDDLADNYDEDRELHIAVVERVLEMLKKPARGRRLIRT